jgi:hypothetical protein
MSVRQIRQIVLGSRPRMPLFVMIVIANVIPSPRVHAKRFGFAETQSGGRPSVIARATTPTGLERRPMVRRARNSRKKTVATTWSGRYCLAKYA